MARDALLRTRVGRDIAEQPGVLGRVIDANADALEGTRRIVGGARTVRLLGIGSSRHAAAYGAEALEALAGVRAAVGPAPGARVTRPVADASDAVVAVSQSGATPALLDAVRDLAGVPLIAVTNAPGSPLDELASVALSCEAGAEHVVPATKSLTAQMLLLRGLARPVEGDAVTRLAEAADETLELAAAPERPDAVVAGGFAGEPLADEIALKLAEMAGRLLPSASLVDFLHGPVAASARPLLVLDPDDPNSRADLPAGRFRLGTDPTCELPLPPTGDPTLDVLVAVVAGQALAHDFALANGEDPDAERGLSKVTRTR